MLFTFRTLFFLSLISISFAAYSQTPARITSGKLELEIGGTVSSYYNYRTYAAGVIGKKDKNTFRLKDARLDLQGKYGNDFEYHLQVDFGSIGQSPVDPASPPVYDANFTYKGFKKVCEIEVGFDKVPYSLSSLVEHEWSPYWERPAIVKGDAFSRRDLGVKLQRNFWNKRVRLMAGIYTGTGEIALGNVNDGSGAPEYIGRVEFCFPQYRKAQFVDVNNSSKPYLGVGFNARYSKRNLPVDGVFLPGETGAQFEDTSLNYKVVNGEKSVIGADINFQYRGFSLQCEGHMIKGTPQNEADPVLMGLPKQVTNGYFKAGGWYVQGSYLIKKAKTLLSVRYDEFNGNDLSVGMSKYMATSLSYQINGFNSMIRAEFFRNLSQTESINVSKWDNQYRVGWQFTIQ